MNRQTIGQKLRAYRRRPGSLILMLLVMLSAVATFAFSEVYFNANRSGVKCGSPLIKMYAIKNKRTAKVATADNITRSIKINDPGLRL